MPVTGEAICSTAGAISPAIVIVIVIVRQGPGACAI